MRRILAIVCGIAVLYSAVTHVHILHRLLTMHHQDFVHPAFLLSVVIAVIAELLCFVGGVLLLLGAK
jgi:ABC-type Fe3+ transport system permease subunit